MPSQITRAATLKRREISPETEAEREAKRIHTESHAFEEDELDYVKDEETADEDVVGTLTRTSPNHLEAGDGLLGPAFDTLDESIRVLALCFQAHGKNDEFVQAAFRHVLKRRMDSEENVSDPPTPKSSLRQLLSSRLQIRGLPTTNLDSLCSALETAELSHLIKSWSQQHTAKETAAALELLQDVHDYGHHAVPDIIRLIRAPEHQANVAKTRTQAMPKTTAARKVAGNPKSDDNGAKIIKSKAKVKAGAAPKAKSRELALLTTKPSSASRAGASEKKPAAKKGASASPAKRAPPKLDGKQQFESSKAQQIVPSSSPALDEFRKGHSASPARLTGGTGVRRGNALQPKTLRDATPPQPRSKSVPSTSTLVRYVRPDNHDLLVFFVGPDMSTMPQQDIAAACLEAFGKQPFKTCHWSDTVWVAQMNNMPDMFTNVLTLQGVQLTATNADSDPGGHFVACYTGAEIKDDVLTSAVEGTVAEYHPNRSSGRITIHRAPHVDDKSNYVFLVLSKPPPKPLLPILIPGAAGGGRYLTFKPVIMDLDVACFYCGEEHADWVCAGTAQVSKFSVAAKK